MDKQELYVASSRSRGETRLYTTPEIQAQREEIAPTKTREGLAHIAEAAERDGAQLAAHDAALSARLEPLSTAELVSRHDELCTAALRDPGARAERAEIDSLLDGRERIALTAAKLDPPDYITKTIGARPSDPAKRAEWDTAAEGIESYRLRYRVTDTGSALGEAPKGAAARAARERAGRRIERAQRRIGLTQTRTAERSIGR